MKRPEGFTPLMWKIFKDWFENTHLFKLRQASGSSYEEMADAFKLGWSAGYGQGAVAKEKK